MRMIDADEMDKKLARMIDELRDWSDYSVGYADALCAMQDMIADMPTIPAYGQWVKTADRLPELPDKDYCSVWVITYLTGDTIAYPMQYERAIVKGKHVERWRYFWDRLADYVPDYWMPMPKGPEVEE